MVERNWALPGASVQRDVPLQLDTLRWDVMLARKAYLMLHCSLGDVQHLLIPADPQGRGRGSSPSKHACKCPDKLFRSAGKNLNISLLKGGFLKKERSLLPGHIVRGEGGII